MKILKVLENRFRRRLILEIDSDEKRAVLLGLGSEKWRFGQLLAGAGRGRDAQKLMIFGVK